MKAFAYVRVSTEEQGTEDRFSLPHQKEHITDVCKDRGWELIGTFEDQESGKSTKKRTGYQDMMKRLDEVQVIVVHELDRLSRNLVDTLLTIEQLNKNGIKFYSIHDNLDTSEDDAEIKLHFLAVFAHYFRKQLSRKVTGGMEKKAKGGGYNTKAPLGYDLVEKKLVINNNEAEIIRKIYSMYLDNIGIRGIADELNTMGYRTKPTKDYLGGAPFQSFPVRKILINPVYTGVTRWKDVVVEDTHPAIINKETFQQVQDRMQKKNEIGGRAQSSEYLLSGVIRCGHCGHPMQGNTNKGRYSKKKGRAPIYKRYICSNYMKNGGCSFVWSHCEDLDKKVMEAVEMIIPRDEADMYLEKQVDDLNLAQIEREHESIKHTLEVEFPKRYDKQIQLAEKGFIDDVKLENAFNRLKAEETQLKEKLLVLETKLTLTPEARDEIRKAKLASFYSVFDSADIAKKKAWIQTHIKEIRYHDKDNVDVVFYI